MALMRWACVGIALGLMLQGAAAFEETQIGGGAKDAPQKAPAAPVLELPKGPLATGKTLELSGTELNLGNTSGTEVRIPGLGSVGVIPKFDFGLELLYGADQKGLPQDKTNPDDVQIRGTIKHRF